MTIETLNPDDQSPFEGVVFAGDAPAWRQLFERLLAALENGQLKVGSSVPSERDWSQQLKVSRSTVKRAYDELRRIGWLEGIGRGGSLIRRPEQIKPMMNPLKGFTQEMQELGKVPSTRLVSLRVVCDRAMNTFFGLNANGQLLHLVRVRSADDVPMTYERAWYNVEVAAPMRDWNGEGSAYAVLKAAGFVFTSATQTIEAILSNEQETQVFGYEQPKPCLLLKRHVFGEKEVLLEYAEGTFRGDRYTYQLPTQLP